jgi:hypothetical protein
MNNFDANMDIIKKKNIKKKIRNESKNNSKKNIPKISSQEHSKNIFDRDPILMNKNNNNLKQINFQYLEEEIYNLKDQKFDYNFYMKKILNKILISLKDNNFLIADRSMVIFKNEKIIRQFVVHKLELKLIDFLVNNIRYHWSQDIKMISNLVIIKIISTYPEILNKFSDDNKLFIQTIHNNINNQKEDKWDIKFNLKAD